MTPLRLLRRLVTLWRMNHEQAEAHCRAVCEQRELDRQEWLMWRGIVK